MGNLDEIWMDRIQQVQCILNHLPSFSERVHDLSGASNFIGHEENFILGLLQDLYRESLMERTKYLMLCFLESWSIELIKSPHLAEQICGTLDNLLREPTGRSSSIFKTKLIGTLSSIMIVHSIKDSNSKMVDRHISYLLKIANKVNSPGSCLLKKMACNCLTEFEVLYPGLLQWNVPELLEYAQLEFSPAAQDYLVTSAVTFGNLLKEIKGSTPSELLSNEEAKPVPLYTFSEMQKTISMLHGQLSFQSPCGLVRIIQTILKGITTLQMPPEILANFVISCFQSFDLLLLNLAIFLLKTFPSLLHNLTDDFYASRRLSILVNMPQLLVGHRMCCHYLIRAHSKASSTQPHSVAMHTLYSVLFPIPFDGPEMTYTKVESICTLSNLSQEIVPATVQLTLTGFLAVVLKTLQMGYERKKTTTYFRIFTLFCLRYNDTNMPMATLRCIRDLAITKPCYMPHVVDFIEEITSLDKRGLTYLLLGDLIKHVVSLPSSAFCLFLKSHCLLLSLAFGAKDETTMNIINKFKAELSQSSKLHTVTWSEGNAILNVCRSIMLSHRSLDILQNLAGLTQLISQQCNDIDISDRAVFYYHLMGNVSADHYPSILDSGSDQTTPEHNKLGYLDIGAASYITECKTQFLTWERSTEYDASFQADASVESATTVSFEDVLCPYLDHVNEQCNEAPPIYLPLAIRFVANNNDAPSCVYAVSLRFSIEGPYADIPDISFPHLSYDADEDHLQRCIASIAIRPLYPVPTVCHIGAVFSHPNGTVCHMTLKDLHIGIDDLFQLVPMPSSYQNISASLFRISLFNELWVFIDCNQSDSANDRNEYQCALSVKFIHGNGNNKMLNSSLHRFIIPSKDQLEMRLMMFLPPRSHVLMKVNRVDGGCVVTIATDNWHLLPFVDDHLSSFNV